MLDDADQLKRQEAEVGEANSQRIEKELNLKVDGGEQEDMDKKSKEKQDTDSEHDMNVD